VEVGVCEATATVTQNEINGLQDRRLPGVSRPDESVDAGMRGPGERRNAAEVLDSKMSDGRHAASSDAESDS
jgi:hypothetical protein